MSEISVLVCTFDVALHEDYVPEIAMANERVDLWADFMTMEAKDEVLPNLALDFLGYLSIKKKVHSSRNRSRSDVCILVGPVVLLDEVGLRAI